MTIPTKRTDAPAWWRCRLSLGLAAGLAICVVVLLSAFEIGEVESSSMEPVLRGRGNPPSRDGDLILVRRWLSTKRLRVGDLVVVEQTWQGHGGQSVRQVANLPGELLDGKTVPQGKYYLLASSKDGIDSRRLGFYDASQIVGVVTWVWRCDPILRPRNQIQSGAGVPKAITGAARRSTALQKEASWAGRALECGDTRPACERA